MNTFNDCDDYDNGMSNDQFSDMIENLNIVDHYNKIAFEIYNEIFNDISIYPNCVYSKLDKNSASKFWEFIVDNCIGIKYLNNTNKIYNFKDKYLDKL